MFWRPRVGIGGNGTLYANNGIEATAINVAGVGTISTLTVNNDITCAHATNTNIIANKNLTLAPVGDESGGNNLHMRNRGNDSGAVFGTTGTVPLVDFIFKLIRGKRNIRLEGRTQFATHGATTWQIGGPKLAPPTLQVGDNSASLHQPADPPPATSCCRCTAES